MSDFLGRLTNPAFRLKRFLVGKPIPSHLAHHERLSRITGLAVLSSDALSSVAYATDFILLHARRRRARRSTTPCRSALVIAALLAIVAFSYRQTIFAYPTGGGAYIVAKENIGANAGPDRRRVAAGRLHADRLGQHFRRRARHHVRFPSSTRIVSRCVSGFSRF